uniref:Uncharacterized protein n=1 Tax=Sphaerodactylus townsendi TaxID=933632 RepID=A0ACB8FB26_9SAUR
MSGFGIHENLVKSQGPNESFSALAFLDLTVSRSKIFLDPNGLLLFTSFFLHVRLSKMSPARLICDRRLIQKYVTEAADMEEQLNRAKGQEVLLDVEKLVDGTAAAQEELRQGCAAGPLQKLYERSRSFILQLRNFEWQEQAGSEQPEEPGLP